MLHFYIDESGTGLRDKRSPYFVLAATCIPLEGLAVVDERINDLKRRLVPFAEPEDYELKVRGYVAERSFLAAFLGAYGHKLSRS